MQPMWRNFGGTETEGIIGEGNGEQKIASLFRDIYALQQNKPTSQHSKNPGTQCEELHLELCGN